MNLGIVLLLFITIIIFDCRINSLEYDVGKGRPVRYSKGESSAAETTDDGKNIYDNNLETFLRAIFSDNPEVVAFLQVDLTGTYFITKIIVYLPANSDSISYTGQFNVYVRPTISTDYLSYDIPNQGLFGNVDLSNASLVQPGSGFCFVKAEGLAGRYVTLKKSETYKWGELIVAVLYIISEVSYYGPVDLINATQNNVYYISNPNYFPPTYFPANNSIDKNPSTCSYTGQVDEVNRKIPGWWMVELVDNHNVFSISINNIQAANIQDAQSAKFDIFVQESTTSPPQLCHSVVEPMEQVRINRHFQCAANVFGKVVLIRKTGGEKIDSLLLCEVNVFGKRLDVQPLSINIATKSNSAGNENKAGIIVAGCIAALFVIISIVAITYLIRENRKLTKTIKQGSNNHALSNGIGSADTKTPIEVYLESDTRSNAANQSARDHVQSGAADYYSTVETNRESNRSMNAVETNRESNRSINAVLPIPRNQNLSQVNNTEDDDYSQTNLEDASTRAVEHMYTPLEVKSDDRPYI